MTYIDRVNISVTARQMMPAYGMTDQQMGWVFSAFVVGYALFQIPGGWLADRWGVRVVLTVALLWWSICTALTAMVAASSLANLVGIIGALMLVRFSLGMGEAVALPAFNRAVTNWFPAGRVMFPRASALAELALRRTDFIAPQKLEPVYLRETKFVKAPPPRTWPAAAGT